MSEKIKKTVRIVRRPKVGTDERGHTVWLDEVETAELELVTTSMLRRVLTSDDEKKKKQIEKAATGRDGVLARDPELDNFEIIDDSDLQEILKNEAQRFADSKDTDVILESQIEPGQIAELTDIEDEELSLVSTQMLRTILGSDDLPEESDMNVQNDGGFDPYNSG